MSDARLYTVDTADEHKATLIDDQGKAITVATLHLPRGSIGGMVLRVPMDENGSPDWAVATIDSGESNRRKRISRDMLSKIDRISGDHEGE